MRQKKEGSNRREGVTFANKFDKEKPLTHSAEVQPTVIGIIIDQNHFIQQLWRCSI